MKVQLPEVRADNSEAAKANAQAAKSFQEFVLKELDRRFAPMEDVRVITKAMMCDPRFLKTYFTKPTAFAATLSDIEQEVRQVMKDDTDENAAAAAPRSEDVQPVPETGTSSGTPASSLWAAHDAKVALCTIKYVPYLISHTTNRGPWLEVYLTCPPSFWALLQIISVGKYLGKSI